MKLVIEYSEDGEAIADLKVSQWMECVLDRIKKSPDSVHTTTLHVGTAIMVDAVRVAIKREQLNHEDVTFQFKGQILNVDKNGKIDNWPKGFCDTTLIYLEELFEILHIDKQI